MSETADDEGEKSDNKNLADFHTPGDFKEAIIKDQTCEKIFKELSRD